MSKDNAPPPPAKPNERELSIDILRKSPHPRVVPVVLAPPPPPKPPPKP